MTTVLLNPYRVGASGTPPGPVELVQANSGHTGTAATPASFNATLGNTPASGNMLLLAVSCDATVTTPAGWTLDDDAVASNATYLFRKTSNGTETSVTLTPSVGRPAAWGFMEWRGQYTAATPLLVATSVQSSTAAATASTGTTGSASPASAGLAIAVFGRTRIGGAAVTSSGYTNGFTTELLDTGTTLASGNNVSLAVAVRSPTADGTFESTATYTAVARPSSIMAVYRVGAGGSGDPPPPPPPPPGEFMHGRELTPSNIGLPDGWTPTETRAGEVISTANAVRENIRYTDVVRIAAANVTFRNCLFEARCWNSEDPAFPFLVENCEFGVTYPAAGGFRDGSVGNCNYTARRCYFHDVYEGARTQASPGTTTLIEECYIHRIAPPTAPHTDCVQLDGQSGMNGGTIIVRRCYLNGQWRDFSGAPGEWGSSAATFNGRNATTNVHTNVHVEVVDCYLAGGSYTLRCEDGNATTNNTYVVTGNDFERGNYQYGTHANSDTTPDHITWSNNKFGDNGQIIPL